MWVIVLRAALLAAVLTALCIYPSALATTDLLACQAKDAVNLQKDGTLKADSVAQRAAQGSLVIDLSNGEVRSGDEQESLKMTARQHGNETVLVPSLAPEFVRNVIRIHQTAGQIIFSQYIFDLFTSGTCACSSGASESLFLWRGSPPGSRTTPCQVTAALSWPISPRAGHASISWGK